MSVFFYFLRRVGFSLIRTLVLNCESFTGGSEMPFPTTRNYPMALTPHRKIWIESREIWNGSGW